MNNTHTYYPANLGLVASHYRSIRGGQEYERFFAGQQMEGSDPLLERDGDVFSTLDHMEAIVEKYSKQTTAIANHLRGGTRKQTCKNIWDFCYNHIQYKLDKAGEEQLRTPLRSWRDRKTGIDCDCYSILVASMLRELRIPFAFRIIKLNGKADYQHVYVVVPTTGTDMGKSRTSYIVIDPVLNKFDMEAPGITQIHDKGMSGIPVRLLNGLGNTPVAQSTVITSELPTAQLVQAANELTADLKQGGLLDEVVTWAPDVPSRKKQMEARLYKVIQNYRKILLLQGAHLRKDYNLVQFVDLILQNWNDPKRRYAAWLAYAEADRRVRNAIENSRSKSFFDKVGDTLGDIAAIPGKAVNWAIDKVDEAWRFFKQNLFFVHRQLIRAAIALNVFDTGRKINAGLLTWAEAQKKGYSLKQWQTNVANTKKVEDRWYSMGGNIGDLRSAVGQGAAPSGIKLGALGGDPVTDTAAATAGTGLVASVIVPLLEDTKVIADIVSTVKEANQNTDSGTNQQYPSTNVPAPQKNEGASNNTGLLVMGALGLLAIALIATNSNS